jgi:hypothetical protein
MNIGRLNRLIKLGRNSSKMPSILSLTQLFSLVSGLAKARTVTSKKHAETSAASTKANADEKKLPLLL